MRKKRALNRWPRREVRDDRELFQESASSPLLEFRTNLATNALPGETGRLWRAGGFLDGKEFGYVETYYWPKENPRLAEIAFVEIYPNFRGKGLCNPLVRFAMRSILALHPKIKQIELTVSGDTPLIAATCYQRAAHDLRLTAFGKGHRVKPTSSGPLGSWRWEDHTSQFYRLPPPPNHGTVKPKNARMDLRLQK